MKKLCIFDLDGTLLDTLGQIHYYMNRTLTKFSMPEIELKTMAKFVGWGAPDLIKRTLAYTEQCGTVCPVSYEEFFDDYLKTYNSGVDFMVKAYDGIPQALDEIKNMGITVAVHSNKPHSTVAPVIERFFPGVFDAVLGAKEGNPLKPNPEASIGLCKSLGAEPENTLFIGDSEIDMQTAKAMNALAAVGALWGFRDEKTLSDAGADVLLALPSEIPTYAKERFKL